MSGKPRRRHRITELLDRHRVTSQEQLQALLAADGIEATQATISRDLRDLGVVKGPTGYHLPGRAAPAEPGADELERALASFLISADAAGNLVVLRTGPGRAQALALDLDRASLRGVLGSVAGDDTIFLAARTPAEAARLLHYLRRAAGLATRNGKTA